MHPESSLADWGPLGFEIAPGSIAALGPPPESLVRERRVLEALGGPHAWEGVPGPQSCASRRAGDELVVRLQRLEQAWAVALEQRDRLMALEPPLRRTRRPPQLAHKLAVERPQALVSH